MATLGFGGALPVPGIPKRRHACDLLCLFNEN